MIIGVTGCFGSGKSTVTRMIQRKTGYAVADADKIAKRVLASRKRAVKKVLGTSNQKELAEIVFSDSAKLRKLNSIIHPHVRKNICAIAKTNNKNVIADVPLLIETRLMKTDVLIIVKAKKKDQLERLERIGWSRKNALKRLSHQMSFSEKMKNSGKISKNVFIVENNHLRDTENQINKILAKTGAGK